MSAGNPCDADGFDQSCQHANLCCVASYAVDVLEELCVMCLTNGHIGFHHLNQPVQTPHTTEATLLS